LEQRNEAKKTKNFDLSDKIRDEISLLWYNIIDDRNGTRLEKK
jgi:cysteinyl-tRNA synthetase